MGAKAPQAPPNCPDKYSKAATGLKPTAGGKPKPSLPPPRRRTLKGDPKRLARSCRAACKAMEAFTKAAERLLK